MEAPFGTSRSRRPCASPTAPWWWWTASRAAPFRPKRCCARRCRSAWGLASLWTRRVTWCCQWGCLGDDGFKPVAGIVMDHSPILGYFLVLPVAGRVAGIIPPFWSKHQCSVFRFCWSARGKKEKKMLVQWVGKCFWVDSFFSESVWAKGSSNSGGLLYTSSNIFKHLHIFSSSHFLIFSSSHLLIFTSSHLLIFTSSHLQLLIFTSAHLHTFSSSHLLIFTSSHLHIFSSSHLLIFSSSHLLIFSSSHLLIFTSSHLHIFSSSTSHLHICSSSHLLIFTSSHLHIFSSSHLLIFTSSHLHIFSSSHLLIFTSAHLHTFSSSHLLIFTSSHLQLLIFTSAHLHTFSSSHLLSLGLLLSWCLALLPSCPLLSPSFLFLSKAWGSANEAPQNATLSHEMKFDRQKLR